MGLVVREGGRTSCGQGDVLSCHEKRKKKEVLTSSVDVGHSLESAP